MSTTSDKVWKNTPMPGVKVKVLDTEEGHALSAKLFHEMDRNCNTCKNLVRLGMRRGSLHIGKCLLHNDHPYQQEIVFSPLDYQGSACWQPRE